MKPRRQVPSERQKHWQGKGAMHVVHILHRYASVAVRLNLFLCVLDVVANVSVSSVCNVGAPYSDKPPSCAIL